MSLAWRFAAAIAPLPLTVAPACADALQDQVAAAIRASSTADVGFTQTTRVERTGSSAKTYVTRYDPRAAAANRWTLVSVDGRAPTPKETGEVLKSAKSSPVPSYARLGKWIGAPATRIAQGPGSVTYRFARLPDGIVKMGSHDGSADTAAEVLINTAGKAPYVERVRFSSAKPFRMMLVARIERYVFTSSYTLLPDGRPFPNGTDADMAGSLMGKAGTMTTRTRYADVRAAR